MDAGTFYVGHAAEKHTPMLRKSAVDDDLVLIPSPCCCVVPRSPHSEEPFTPPDKGDPQAPDEPAVGGGLLRAHSSFGCRVTCPQQPVCDIGKKLLLRRPGGHIDGTLPAQEAVKLPNRDPATRPPPAPAWPPSALPAGQTRPAKATTTCRPYSDSNTEWAG